MALIDEKKKELYTQLHKSHPGYGNGLAIFNGICLIVNFLKPRRILDYGCGKGRLVKELRRNFPWIQCDGYDPCVEEFSKIPDGRYDLVVNTDVLEHIPETNIPEVLSHMKTFSDYVYFHLHHAKAVAVLANGENAHCTVKPPVWYHDLILKTWGKCTPLISELELNSVALSFDLPANLIYDWSYMILKKNQTRNK